MKLKESLITRRQFLQGFLTSLFALFSGSNLFVFFRFLRPASLDLGPSEVKLSLEEIRLEPNTAKVFAFGRKPGLLILTENKEWIAFNAVCTHFECTVHYDPSTQQIVCPCHKGFYDRLGKNIKGPPPKPLERFTVTEEEDGLMIAREVQGEK